MRKVLLILFLCSSLFVGAFTICAATVLKLTFEHVNLIGGGNTPFDPHETVIFWVCIAGLVASFAIHPFGAYLVRRDIRRLTSSAKLQTVMFVVFATFQVTLLAFAYGAFETRNYIARQHGRNLFRAHEEVAATLDNAKVEVIVKNAKVISDDGKFILAEVTLQIKNVPFSIPYYEMNIHGVGTEESFRPAGASPYLRVTNSSRKWIFYDTFNKQEVSDNSENVVLRFGFSRVNTSGRELPNTITPRLGIWARDDKVYYRDHIFFYQPIPVSFEELKTPLSLVVAELPGPSG